MPVSQLVDLSKYPLDRVVISKERIYDVLPHRFEMALLDGILHFEPGHDGVAIGFHDVRDDEFWVRGHIPGRPLMPGVLIVESAGQLCGYFFETVMVASGERFFGFAGLEEIRFRGVVKPGDRLHLACRPRKMRPSSGVFDAQGYVNGEIVFDCVVKGMAIPR